MHITINCDYCYKHKEISSGSRAKIGKIRLKRVIQLSFKFYLEKEQQTSLVDNSTL